MARGDLIIPTSRRRVRRALFICGLIVLGVLLVPTIRLMHGIRTFNRQFASLAAERTAMQQMENYQPVERFLARLMQSDRAFSKSDDGEPPDWVPPELGKLGPHYINVSPNGVSVDCGGGMIDFFGYDLTRDKASSTATTSVFDFIYQGDPDRKEHVLDHFSLPATDSITEEELVKSALIELARRQKAFANETQFNFFGDDPIADRRRLIAQHQTIARRLGLLPATAPTTVP